MKKEVSIIGAGFSGLSLAYYLVKKGFSVQILESDEVGGLLGTHQTPFGIAEKAANAIMADDKMIELCQEIKIPILFAERESKKRYFFRPNFGLTQWPLSVLESICFFINILVFLPKFFLMKKMVQPMPGQSIESWINKHFGDPVSENLVQPGLNGIYAHSIKKLSASIIFSRIFIKKKSRSKAKGLISFQQGMGGFIHHLKTYLENHGVAFLNKKVLNWSELQALSGTKILCVPAFEAATLLQSHFENISEDLKKISYSPLLTITVFFQPDQMVRQGFGCLFNSQAQTQALGVLWNKFIFKDRGPHYSETWILGGDKSPNLIHAPDHTLIDEILNSRKALFCSNARPLEHKITRWKNGLPFYSIESEKAIQNLQQQPLKDQRVYFHGNYLGGIGLSQIANRGSVLSEQINQSWI